MNAYKAGRAAAPWEPTSCTFCSEPSVAFVGPEHKPYAYFCDAHDRRFMKSNAKARGRMLSNAGVSIAALGAERVR